MAWKVKSKKEVYRNPYMFITEDVVENEAGEELVFGVVHKDPAVLIIPWDGKHFTLVGQYRYPTDNFSWEFPQGHYERGGVEVTAIKELEEEAGLKASKLEEIGIFDLANGHHTQKYFVYLATDLTAGKTKREKGERGMKIRKFTLEELEKGIMDRKIKDSPTVTGLEIFKLHQKYSDHTLEV